MVCNEPPEGFFDRLEIGPTFYTEFGMRRMFEGPPPRFGKKNRPIELNARFGSNGAAWYSAMRSEAKRAVEALNIKRRKKTQGPFVDHRAYLAELRRSKICFSPYGYGEICLRDFEAMATGAMLIKPSVADVETAPNFFRPFETYVPLKVDCSDLEEKTAYYLQAEDERRAIAEQAFNQVADWLTRRRFASHFDRLFAGLD